MHGEQPLPQQSDGSGASGRGGKAGEVIGRRAGTVVAARIVALAT